MNINLMLYSLDYSPFWKNVVIAIGFVVAIVIILFYIAGILNVVTGGRDVPKELSNKIKKTQKGIGEKQKMKKEIDKLFDENQ